MLPTSETFRLNQPLNVVHLEGNGKCEPSILPSGSLLRIERDSRVVPGCVEITCEERLYGASEEKLRQFSTVIDAARSDFSVSAR